MDCLYIFSNFFGLMELKCWVSLIHQEVSDKAALYHLIFFCLLRKGSLVCWDLKRDQAFCLVLEYLSLQHQFPIFVILMTVYSLIAYHPYWRSQFGWSTSFIWRYLLWRRDLIVSGLRWKADDGRSICVYANAWVPILHSFKIMSPARLPLATMVFESSQMRKFEIIIWLVLSLVY